MLKNLIIGSLLGGLMSISAFAQQQQPKPNAPLPLDPQITIGKLSNGLTYYIRENKKPENRAELRLAVNVGSILEDDDQSGLAHFVEHLAFNGTKNFAKHEIVDFLESIGMRFGPDINAYTSFDETVYMLQLPTDNLSDLETGLVILGEWAQNIAFEEEEIDKERGVVLEEWRIGRGAQARIQDKQFPVIFHNSRYAKRLPIGTPETIRTAPHDVIKRFYEDWYRPDLMAVVAIGDFDKGWMENKIKEQFSKIPAPQETGRKRETYTLPDHKETLVTIASDLEATNTQVVVYYKQGAPENGTLVAYRKMLLANLYNNMLNKRLQELLQQEDPPFLTGFSAQGNVVRTKDFYILGAAVQEDAILPGLNAILSEAKRVRDHGFTVTEFDRAKVEMLRAMEQGYKERDKTESQLYASEYIRNFFTGESLPGIEFEYKTQQKLLPKIKLDEVNNLARQWIRDSNRVIALSAPDKTGMTLPDKKELLQVFETVNNTNLAAFKDEVSELPLLQHSPKPGRIIKENTIPEISVTEWELSNGVKVVLKPTDFKNDEILFTSYSPGGHSLVSDENFIAASTSASIIRQGGLGDFNQIALQKKLAGKLINVTPYINELEEGLSGNAAPQDIEKAMELIYLYFTSPRMDETAYKSFKKRITEFIRNRHANPNATYSDTLQATMSDYHHRTRPWSLELLNEMNLKKSFRIYQDRFADASDFTFFFIGTFSLNNMKPLVEKYLGGLPALNRNEKWRDVGIRRPKGVVHKTVKQGLEPKSQVNIIFSGLFRWNKKNRFNLSSMAEALKIRLQEVLREDRSGTYGVRVTSSTTLYPTEEYNIGISFGCAPNRVKELSDAVFSQIDSLKEFGLTKEYITKVKQGQRRAHEIAVKENHFWLNALRASYFQKSNPAEISNYIKMVDKLSTRDVQEAAQIYFNMKNYAHFALYPKE